MTNSDRLAVGKASLLPRDDASGLFDEVDTTLCRAYHNVYHAQ